MANPWDRNWDVQPSSSSESSSGTAPWDRDWDVSDQSQPAMSADKSNSPLTTSGLLKDAANSLLNAVSSQNPLASQLETVGSRNPISNVRDLAQGAISAPPKLGQLLAQATFPILRKAGIDTPYMHQVENFDWDKFTSPIGSGENNSTANLGRGLGTAVSFAPLGGESLLGQLLAGGAQQAVNTQSGEENLGGLLPSGKLGGFIEGGLLSAAAPETLSATKRLAEALRPTNLLKGTISPEKLRANLDAAGNTPTNLGSVINNEFLKKQFENIISKVPGSGAPQKLHDANKAVQDSANTLAMRLMGTTERRSLDDNEKALAEDALKKTLGRKQLFDINGQTNDEGEDLVSGIFGTDNHREAVNKLGLNVTNEFEKQEKIKSAFYKARNEAADNDPNFKMEPTSFAQLANYYKDSISESSLLKNEPDQRKLFGRMQNYENPVIEKTAKSLLVDKNGKPLIENKSLTYPTLSDAQNLKSRLSAEGKAAEASPDAAQRGMAKVYKSLAGALDKDINSSIENSGNTELKKLHDTANLNYKNNFLPFLDKDIYKYAKGFGDKDAMVDALIKKTGDYQGKIEKAAKLPGSIRHDLAGAYFSRAFDSEGNFSAEKFAKLKEKLGEGQFKTLVPDSKSRNQINNYVNKYRASQQFSKSLNGDGSINKDSLSKIVDHLQQNPVEFLKKVPNSEARQSLSNFNNAHKRNNFFKDSLQPDGNVNIAKISTLARNLSKNPSLQDQILPEGTLGRELSNFNKLSYMNRNAGDMEHNPMTGNKMLDFIPALLAHAGGAALGGAAGKLTGALTGIVAPGVGHVVGAAAGLIAPALLSRPLVSKLTSPETRKNLVENMLRDEPRFNKKLTTKEKIAVQTLAQALANAQGGNAQ